MQLHYTTSIDRTIRCFKDVKYEREQLNIDSLNHTKLTHRQLGRQVDPDLDLHIALNSDFGSEAVDNSEAIHNSESPQFRGSSQFRGGERDTRLPNLVGRSACLSATLNLGGIYFRPLIVKQGTCKPQSWTGGFCAILSIFCVGWRSEKGLTRGVPG